jgi:hypothetical protein
MPLTVSEWEPSFDKLSFIPEQNKNLSKALVYLDALPARRVSTANEIYVLAPVINSKFLMD